MISKEEIGRRIKAAREEARLSQEELGKLWEKGTHAAISDIERGKTNVSAADLVKLAAILKKDVRFFLGEEPEFNRGVLYARGARTEGGSIDIESQTAVLKFKKYVKNKLKREKG